MLIATLPPVYQENLLEEIISHPFVAGVRYNIGMASCYSPKETLERILRVIERYDKRFWVDLKGRQIRIRRWAMSNYGKIVLSHEIEEIELPATVYFRGDDKSEIVLARGNVIYVNPPPRYAVGEGQAINIHSGNLKLKGYLTCGDEEYPGDHEYLQAACELGIKDYMLSFVESERDIVEVQDALRMYLPSGQEVPRSFVLKIESLKGLDFIDSSESIQGHTLMAARDDMMINIGDNKAMIIHALRKIIAKDPAAIVASKLFGGLEAKNEVLMGDWSDLHLMRMMGYKHFMLSDGISHYHFAEAMKAWEEYLAAMR